MDRLHAMTVFVAVADALSFAEAARTLRTSRPSVSRAVAALEDHLGVELLARTTRSVALTQAGARYLEDCRRILEAVDDADAAATGAFQEPAGRLVVTAPVMFGRLHVLPVLHAFLEAWPAVDAHLLLVDRVVDLVDEGIDVAVRIGALPDSSLLAVRVGEVTSVVVGSPDYLARRGRPRVPTDLASHDLVAQTHAMRRRNWSFGGQRVPVEPRILTNDVPATLELAMAGAGLARVLSYQAAAGLAAGRLQRVLEDSEPEPLPVHLVHAGGRRTPARTRAFVDLAREILRDRGRNAWRTGSSG